MASGCLANIAFYFLLHVGKYTKPRFIIHNGQKSELHALPNSLLEMWGVHKWKNHLKKLPTSSPTQLRRHHPKNFKQKKARIHQQRRLSSNSAGTPSASHNITW
jgi:hypothetical protein